MCPSPPEPMTVEELLAAVACTSGYALGQEIGSGNFATVYAAVDMTSGEEVAVKTIFRPEASGQDEGQGGRAVAERTAREVDHLRMLRHTHIIQLYHFLETEDVYMMVMERAADESLFHHVADRRGLPPKQARRIFQQLISAVEYCHLNGIVHRDIKLDNILLDFQNNAKLADFQMSAKIDPDQLMTDWCGSPAYRAPEIVDKCPYWGPAVDVWSCGVVLYAMLCARFPWGHGSDPNTKDRIRRGSYTLPVFLPCALVDIIVRILIADPVKRYKVCQIQAHPWFTQDWPLYLQELSRTARQESRIVAENSQNE